MSTLYLEITAITVKTAALPSVGVVKKDDIVGSVWSIVKPDVKRLEIIIKCRQAE